jgi:G protein-coupled receptor kinase
MNLLDEAIIERCELGSGNKEQFVECVRQVKEFLADKPFRLFEQSMYFYRYLQWKWLEG